MKRMKDWEGFNFPSDKIVIGGPCSAETRQQTLESMIGAVQAGANMVRLGLWKPRTMPNNFEGVGYKGLDWIVEFKTEYPNIPVCLEIPNADVISNIHGIVDAVWIGARTTTSPFAVEEIAKELAKFPMPVFVKNPMNPDVKLWKGAIKRLLAQGLTEVAAIHRGFSVPFLSDVYRNPPMWHLVDELRDEFEELDVICDVSHIAGSRELIQPVWAESIRHNFNGVMVETHNNPDVALSDSQQQIIPVLLGRYRDNLYFSKGGDAPKVTALDLCRREIDSVNLGILKLLGERYGMVDRILSYKKEHNMPILQQGRMDSMMVDIREYAEANGLSNALVDALFGVIHLDSLRRQGDNNLTK